MRPKLGIPEGLASCLGGTFEMNRPDCDKESPTLKDALARVDVGGEDDLENFFESGSSRSVSTATFSVRLESPVPRCEAYTWDTGGASFVLRWNIRNESPGLRQRVTNVERRVSPGRCGRRG